MKKKSLVKLHQRIGLSSIIILITLSITGVALNHTESLSLKAQPITQNWLYNWYGIEIPKYTKHAALAIEENHIWAVQLENDVWVNNQSITQGKLIGFGETSYGYALILVEQTVLLSPELEMIDILANPATSFTSLNSQKPIIAIDKNGKLWAINTELTEWIQINKALQSYSVRKATPSLPESLLKEIQQSYYSQGLNWERVILDLHSGRIFGPVGIFIIDIFALLLIVLSITGYYLYSRKNPKK